MLSAKSDPTDIKPNGHAFKIMKERPEVFEKCDFTLYDDMIHGWVNRGDLNDEKIKRDYEDSMNKSWVFFDKYV